MMSDSEAILEGIRYRRETRDRIMLQNLISILNQLRQTADNWIDDEFRDLEDEISHLDIFAVRDSASERIIRLEGVENDIQGDVNE
jgi:hypothetical protein